MREAFRWLMMNAQAPRLVSRAGPGPRFCELRQARLRGGIWKLPVYREHSDKAPCANGLEYVSTDRLELPWWLRRLRVCLQETWVRSLSWEDALEKGIATPSSILAWRIPWMEEWAGYSPQGCKESDTAEAT